MLRYAAQHFEMLRPFRWRLQRMAALARPQWGGPQNHILMVVDHLDRLAQSMLTAEEFERFKEPWMPKDQE